MDFWFSLSSRSLCFSKLTNMASIMLNQIPWVEITNFWSLAADLNAESIVNFNVKFFRLRSLSYSKVVKNSITRFTSQIKVYFGWEGLLLKIPDRGTATLEFKPTGMSPMGSWYTKIADKILQLHWIENFHESIVLKNLRCRSKGV